MNNSKGGYTHIIGRYLENCVYLELRRQYKEIFYYRTKNDLEVDFLVRKGTEIVTLIQVTMSLRESKTRDRELKALFKAMEELQVTEGAIITLDEEEIEYHGLTITVIPAYKWLLT